MLDRPAGNTFNPAATDSAVLVSLDFGVSDPVESLEELRQLAASDAAISAVINATLQARPGNLRGIWKVDDIASHEKRRLAGYL